MGELPATLVTSPDSKNAVPYEGSITSITMKKLRQKDHLGGKMNAEEIRMNKQMLSDIAKLKKQIGGDFSSPNQSN